MDDTTENIYAHIALYDIRRRKKMSENFYFDFNSCVTTGNDIIDTTTRSRTCVFDIDGAGSINGDDLFLVIRLEKPLRGDSDSIISSSDTSVFSTINDKVICTFIFIIKYNFFYKYKQFRVIQSQIINQLIIIMLNFVCHMHGPLFIW